MSQHVLAKTLGKILGKRSGLRYFSVPTNIPTKFIGDMASAANHESAHEEFAFHVSQFDEGPNVISPERAAELRSRENGDAAEALIIAKEGESKELKTLATFVHVNPLSVVNGIGGVEVGDLTLNEICKTISELVNGGTESEQIASAAEYVLSYLGDAYKAYGNEDISWKAAWWMHAMLFADALRDALGSETNGPEANPNLALQAYVFAAAGLPTPTDTDEWKFDSARHGHSVYARRVLDRWQNGEGAHLAVTDMEMLFLADHEDEENSEYPLSALDWLTGYDATVATQQHPMLAVAYHEVTDSNHWKAWVTARETDFFVDISEHLGSTLLTRDSEGELVNVPSVPDLEPVHYILSSEYVETDEDRKQVLLGEYFLSTKIPYGQLELDDFELKTSPTKLDFGIPELMQGEDELTLIRIHFSVKLSKSKNKWKDNPYKLTIRPVVRRGRTPPFTQQEQISILADMPGAVSYYLVSKSAGDSTPNKLVPIPDRAFELSESGDVIELDHDSRDRDIKFKGAEGEAGVLLIGPSCELLVNEKPRNVTMPFKKFPQVRWLSKLLLPDGCRIECGDDGLTVSLENQVTRPLSPIVAAAMDTVPGVHETGSDENMFLGDPRGLLERDWLAEFYMGDAEAKRQRSGFPQALVFPGVEGSVGELSFDQSTGFHVVGGSTNMPSQPEQLSTGQLTSSFWDAFDELRLGDLAQGFPGITSHWPSRLRLLDLDKKKLENYLSAFYELVSFAKDDESLKWALYPFSAILFDAPSGSIAGILLSPLHPLRLAWAWSVQSAAEEAQGKVNDVVRLMRFADGGNLPICGPSPDGIGRLAASPLDSGPEELFVTWSYLGNASAINAGTPPPARISGFRFPAGTASGLDKGGVAAAINDYLRVYPYVSELRLGLSSQAPRPRSAELDRAVVAELDSLLRGRANQLPGGIKVFDSKNRQGPIPDKEQLLAKVTNAMDYLDRDDENRLWKFPFEWKVGGDEHVDIRFVEDSIVKVTHDAGTPALEETGVLPPLPIRRGYAWLDQRTGDQWRSGCTPLVRVDESSALPAFVASLRELECWDGAPPTTWSYVPIGQSLRDTNVNWMVAGNANLDPRLLSKALQRLAIADKVLWEWRPPYLPRRWKDSQSSITAANPYTVVATLSADFKSQVKQELDNSIGRSDDNLFGRLFEELGARGVGIASLLSMGYQQSRGAVGFYLGFKLASWWERAASSNEVRMVLPLDAVNPVFETLAQAKPGDDRKKADLLLISARKLVDGQIKVSFIAVEIKNHAAKKEQHEFPATSSTGVKNALAQLKNSRKLLDSVIGVIDPKPRPTLLNATMATILEIGVSLGTGENRDLGLLREILSGVASGTCEFEMLPGALFWFERFGHGHDREPFLVRKPTSIDKIAKIFVDPEQCYDEIEAGTGSRVAELFVEIFGSDDGPPESYAPQQGSERDQEPESAQESGPLPEAESEATPATAAGAAPPVSTAVGEQVQSEGDQPVPDDRECTTSPEAEPAAAPRVDARPQMGKVAAETLESRYEQIIDTLEQFGISVLKPNNVNHYSEGPASITYRVKPARGTRPGKIEAERNSLKLELELTREQHINTEINEGCVEIIVPKKDSERYFVDARVLWSTWRRPSNALEVPIGIDNGGGPVSINFSSPNSPHLLIGGTTGSGKSEALNTLLYGLTEHYKSDELRLLLVDPKGTEMVGFQESPFLERDIGWDALDTIEILDGAVQEMQNRYEAFRSVRKTSLPEYNEHVPKEQRLPWWAIVLDEYADLTSDPDEKKDIEKLLKRLAQKARAAGIHVIIATQKPSAEVINTVLRANLPAQLALKVRSAIESKVIMEESGAETLNGKGDAFLKAEGKTTRLQCALFSQ